ncbi:LuxR C-terminal-related transcriptional regulator [Streptomyces thermocarboxydovorans]|uniref:LuxR C-terminal-related transcriptional regulator n=1 Tax=Streptomyces thermocarboxydovorans TaxID=59298 RepID=A0ABN1HHL6_9ACTN
MTERSTDTRRAPGPVRRTSRAGDADALHRARDAAAREAWAEAYGLLHRLDPARLVPDDWAVFADAAWWGGHIEESIDRRTRAHAGYASAGAERRAGLMAWLLYYEHMLAGRSAVAAGWLRRARRHLCDQPDCVEQCYLAWVDTERAQERGDFAAAMETAGGMGRIAQRCGSADLLAMSVQAQAGVLMAQGRMAEGLEVLDEAMCAVMAGELSSFFTGWIYCLGLQRCMACADVERAAEWTEAAMDWCASMPAENNFRGLCRVHRAEVLELRGDWTGALAEGARTCEELLRNERPVAGRAFCLLGDVRRRRGEYTAAREAYRRAHELGADPQPGLALLHLAEGHAESAAGALRAALAWEGDGGVERCRLLAAQVEVALAMDRLDEARTAAGELTGLAGQWQRRRGSRSTPVHASADAAQGAVALAAHDLDRALPLLRRALALWLELDVPYEAAQVRMALAEADRVAGDEEGARMEWRAAHEIFERLGALPDARRAAALLAGARPRPGGLTEREIQVLRLVARGETNRSAAAELVISEHTVARHLNNIFAKLDVSSRAAATAYAYRHGLA